MERILIVDDSRMTRVLVRKALEKAGYGESEFIEASNGAEALNHLRDHDFDLVVTDLYMDRLSGLELVRDMRASGFTVPICMITSERSPEILDEVRAAGVNWLVSKPFKPTIFQEVLSA